MNFCCILSDFDLCFVTGFARNWMILRDADTGDIILEETTDLYVDDFFLHIISLFLI